MLIQSVESEAVPANPAQWLYSVTKREPSREAFLIVSGAATSVCQQSLADSLGGKPRRSWCGIQVNYWTSVHERPATRRCACAHEMVSTSRDDFQIAPKNTGLDCRDQSYQVGQVCDGWATSSRSAVQAERYSTSSLATALSLFVLGAETRAKMKSETDGVKSLMVFAQDTADAAEAQPARPGNVPVLPREVTSGTRSWCRHCMHVPSEKKAHTMSVESWRRCRSSPQNIWSCARLERQSSF